MDVRCVVAVVAGAPIMARCGHEGKSTVMVPVPQGCCVFGVSHRGMTVACRGDMGLFRGVIIQDPDVCGVSSEHVVSCPWIKARNTPNLDGIVMN